ncbi:hypothetical protein ZWY2020_027381 [Hordeum vulgare]|nr:hypothetical protein ZWY2020_027381 [Hordeum vulgare]
MAMGEEAAAAVTAAATSSTPHLLIICNPSQGNVNPMLRLGKRFAAKGLLVTFSSTSDVGAKITASSRVESGGDGVPLGLGRIRFEFLDDHHDGEELKFNDLVTHLETTGPPAFAKLLRRQEEAGRPVACVVGNPFIPWAFDVAHGAGIPYAVLWVQSCAVFSLYYHHVHGLLELPAEDDLDARVKLPGLPALSVTDVPSFLLPSNPYCYKLFTEAILRQFRAIHKPSWVFVNSFSELERDVLDALPTVLPQPPLLIPVGPLFELEEEAAVRGDMMKAADDCVGWLDTQAPRSVVYASLGSMAVLSAEELAEMAHGLTSTGRPFLWVVRPDNSALLPEGYLNSIAGRGMVVPWSPQDLVLAHPSTACFLTHCGWNSTLETLAAGVPVAAFPMWGDQCTDAKYLVEELKIGVPIHGPLRRDAMRDALENVMAGPDADAMLGNARMWSAVARAAVATGGSSDRHIQAFVEVFLNVSR